MPSFYLTFKTLKTQIIMINYNEVIDPKFFQDSVEISISKAEIGKSIIDSQYKNMIVNILLANADRELLGKLYSASNGYIKACPFNKGQVVRFKDTRYLYNFEEKKEMYMKPYGVVMDIDVLTETVKVLYPFRKESLEMAEKTVSMSFKDLEAGEVPESEENMNDIVQKYKKPAQQVVMH